MNSHLRATISILPWGVQNDKQLKILKLSQNVGLVELYCTCIPIFLKKITLSSIRFFWGAHQQLSHQFSRPELFTTHDFKDLIDQLLKNPERFIMSCLWAGSVESCTGFRRFLRFFLGFSVNNAFSFQLSTFWKHFSCINFAIKFDGDRRLDVCISFFTLYVR